MFSVRRRWKYVEQLARTILWHLREAPSTARVTSWNVSTWLSQTMWDGIEIIKYISHIVILSYYRCTCSKLLPSKLDSWLSQRTHNCSSICDDLWIVIFLGSLFLSTAQFMKQTKHKIIRIQFFHKVNSIITLTYLL